MAHFPQMTVWGWLSRYADQGSGGEGDGPEGEPELYGLGTVGEPTEWTVGGALGKPAMLCAWGCKDGVGTDCEPELLVLAGREILGVYPRKKDSLLRKEDSLLRKETRYSNEGRLSTLFCPEAYTLLGFYSIL